MSMKKNPHLITFGQNLSTLRHTKNLTQEQLAERSGLDPSYISGIERGVRNPSYLSIVKLADGLKIEPSAVCANCTRSKNIKV